MLAQPKMKKDRPRKVCAPETHYYNPLYQFHQWLAKLRLLEETEINTVPYVPLSHPFVERLIGTLRRECRTARYFGPSPTWRPSYSISGIIIMSNARRTPRAPAGNGRQR